MLALMDVVIVGHMGSPDYIAAIAVGGTLFNMVYWLFGFLRMGTSGLTAHANGAGDRRDTLLWLLRGLLVAAVASGLLILLRHPLLRLGLGVMDITGPVATLASAYFLFLVWGAPASLAMFVFSGWFIGLKDAKAPMWVSLIVNVGNIAVSLILVYGLGLKVEGVAAGTLTAQWAGLTGALLMARRHIRARAADMQWRPLLAAAVSLPGLARFFRVNTDIFLRTLLLIAVTVWFTRVGASQGTVVLAVNTLLMQFFILFSYFMDGFAFAGESLCGNLLGARCLEGYHRCVRALMRWGIGVAIGFTLIYFLCGEWITVLLSDDAAVRLASREYLGWAVAVPLCGFGAFVWDGICIGAVQTRHMLISMGVAAAVYFLLWWLLVPRMGNHGLWLAFCAYLAARGLLLTILRPRPS